jgi:hypothetical protein
MFTQPRLDALRGGPSAPISTAPWLSSCECMIRPWVSGGMPAAMGDSPQVMRLVTWPSKTRA